MEYKHLQLPLTDEAIRELRAGDACKLSGSLFTLRDAGHQRLLEELSHASELPYGLTDATIFYAGPTPACNDRPFGAIGPTTASRMDFAAPALHEAGVKATIGKGKRSDEVRKACKHTGAIYFIACGGAAAYLAQCVTSSEVLAYDELDTEALRKIEVKDFPVFVGIDAAGNDLYVSVHEETSNGE